MQDFYLREKLAHFNRERIPERVVHAKGAAAFGTFTVTHDITRYTKAQLFSEVGKQTQVRQLCHFFRADPNYGSLVAEGLGIAIDPSMMPPATQPVGV